MRWLKTGLTGTATHDILVGTSQSETISGGAGNDLFFHGGGKDLLTDQAGNDFYRLSFYNDVEVRIQDASGTDGIQMDYSYIKDLGFRRSGTALVIEDNKTNAKVIVEDQFSTGGIETFKAKIYGYPLPDSIMTFTFSPELMGTAAADLIVGTSIDEEITGNLGEDYLVGGGGDDSLYGGDGADILNGGAGKDLMTGGAGRDLFVFHALSDSGTTATTMDTIYDFDHTKREYIDLSGIDADSTTAGNQSFDFISREVYSGTAGELRYEQVGGNFRIDVDVDGDMVDDFNILLAGNIVLRAGDFVL